MVSRFILTSLFYLLSLVFATNCDEQLDFIIRTKFKPRCENFLASLNGFDYIEDYDKCVTPSNETYLLIQAYPYGMIQILFGVCVPKNCQTQFIEKKFSEFIISQNYSSEIPVEKIRFLYPKEYNEMALSKTSIAIWIFLFFYLAYIIILAMKYRTFSIAGPEN